MRVCPVCRATYDKELQACPRDGFPLLEFSQTFATGMGSNNFSAPPVAEDALLQPGMLVGEYQVKRLIAIGGMGAVYEGVHPVISKRVAIKVLNKRFAADPKAVARFVQEARAVNEIGHHNIVDIFSMGELDDQRNFLIMEFLDGLSLAQILTRQKKLQPGEVLPIYEQLCDALSVAHEKSFIHRDLKPDNIFILRRQPMPSIKILDFGIAKLRSTFESETTEVGTVLGTPEYMAPEQCRGLEIDARADIYAMGIMLYELLTGRKPFYDPSPVRILSMHQYETARPPSEYVQIDPMLEAVILCAMAKSPKQRPQTVRDLRDDLRRVIGQATPWSINLEPIAGEKKPEYPANKPQLQDTLVDDIPLVVPPKPRAVHVPRPADLSDDAIDQAWQAAISDAASAGNKKFDESIPKPLQMTSRAPSREMDDNEPTNVQPVGWGRSDPPLSMLDAATETVSSEIRTEEEVPTNSAAVVLVDRPLVREIETAGTNKMQIAPEISDPENVISSVPQEISTSTVKTDVWRVAPPSDAQKDLLAFADKPQDHRVGVAGRIETAHSHAPINEKKFELEKVIIVPPPSQEEFISTSAMVAKKPKRTGPERANAAFRGSARKQVEPEKWYQRLSQLPWWKLVILGSAGLLIISSLFALFLYGF